MQLGYLNRYYKPLEKDDEPKTEKDTPTVKKMDAVEAKYKRMRGISP